MPFAGRGQGRFSTKRESSRVSKKTTLAKNRRHDALSRSCLLLLAAFELQDVEGGRVCNTSCCGLNALAPQSPGTVDVW